MAAKIAGKQALQDFLTDLAKEEKTQKQVRLPQLAA
jgi:hypothetical protein